VLMAERLGLQTVAEGVEDEPTLSCLREIGCDLVQGFHLGRPQSNLQAEDYPDRLRIVA